MLDEYGSWKQPDKLHGMVRLPHDYDTRRDTLRRAHQHFRRMADRHPDWPFGSSLKIEQNRARSVPAQMARIKQAVLTHVSKGEA